MGRRAVVSPSYGWIGSWRRRADVGIGPYKMGCRGGRLCPPGAIQGVRCAEKVIPAGEYGLPQPVCALASQ